MNRVVSRLGCLGWLTCLCGAVLLTAGCDLSPPEGREVGERSESAHHHNRHHNHHENRSENQAEPPRTAHPPNEGPADDLPAAVPAKVKHVLKTIDEEQRAPAGYEGGRAFHNEGTRDERPLPIHDAAGRPIAYREWDVNPKVDGENRGAERLVTGSDGSAYFTRDHYRTFQKVR